MGLVILLYFLPTLVAAIRHTGNTLAVGIFNFFLGWSLVGWLVAMVWAVKSEPLPADFSEIGRART